MQPTSLNQSTLRKLDSSVHPLKFDPTTVRRGMVHLGFGGFHRAHMARYAHTLMDNQSEVLEWGVVGAGPMPAYRRMKNSLRPQDTLYILVERSGTAEVVTVIGSLADVIFTGQK